MAISTHVKSVVCIAASLVVSLVAHAVTVTK